MVKITPMPKFDSYPQNMNRWKHLDELGSGLSWLSWIRCSIYE